MTAVAW